MNWIDKLKKENLITNVEKFYEFLKKNKLSLEIKKVECIGYKGEIKYLPIYDPEVFICCTCSYSSCCAYYGDCYECGHGRCYHCAINGAVHECINYVDKKTILGEVRL